MNPIIQDLAETIDVSQIDNLDQFYHLSYEVTKKEQLDYIQMITFNQYLYIKWLKSKMN